MKDNSNITLKFFGYNAFVLENKNIKIVIDPGKNLKWNKLNSLVPKKFWNNIDVILVTHEHDDHADYVKSIVQKSEALIICHKDLEKKFSKYINSDKIKGLLPGEEIELSYMKLNTFKTVHGKVHMKIWKKKMTFIPKNSPLGFFFSVSSITFMNLGDTIFIPEWKQNFPYPNPDYLMVPAGGIMTMDAKESAEFVRLIKPKKGVFPCHYQWDILFYKRRVDLSILRDTCNELDILYHELLPGESFEIAS